MGGIGAPELLVVLLVVLLVFGPTKIPEVARGLGKGLREFRRLSTEFQREINLAAPDEDERTPDRPAAAPPQTLAREATPTDDPTPAPIDDSPDPPK